MFRKSAKVVPVLLQAIDYVGIVMSTEAIIKEVFFRQTDWDVKLRRRLDLGIPVWRDDKAESKEPLRRAVDYRLTERRLLQEIVTEILAVVCEKVMAQRHFGI